MSSLLVQQPVGPSLMPLPFSSLTTASLPSLEHTSLFTNQLGQHLHYAPPSTAESIQQAPQWLASMQLASSNTSQQLLSAPYIIQIPTTQGNLALRHQLSNVPCNPQWPVMAPSSTPAWTSTPCEPHNTPNGQHASTLACQVLPVPPPDTTTTTAPAAPAPMTISLTNGQQLPGTALFTLTASGELVPYTFPAPTSNTTLPTVQLQSSPPPPPSWCITNSNSTMLPPQQPTTDFSSPANALQPIYLLPQTQQTLSNLHGPMVQAPVQWHPMDPSTHPPQPTTMPYPPGLATITYNTAPPGASCNSNGGANVSMPHNSPAPVTRPQCVSAGAAYNQGASEVTAGVAMKAIRMGHAHANTSSAYLGVTWYKASRRWQARLCCDNKKLHLGYFATEEEAARAYDKAVLEHKGPTAPRNFMDSSNPSCGNGSQPRNGTVPLTNYTTENTQYHQLPQQQQLLRALSDGSSRGSGSRKRQHDQTMHDQDSPRLDDPDTPSAALTITTGTGLICYTPNTIHRRNSSPVTTGPVVTTTTATTATTNGNDSDQWGGSPTTMTTSKRLCVSAPLPQLLGMVAWPNMQQSEHQAA